MGLVNDMMATSKDLLWKEFMNRGEIANSALLPPIAASWSRCLRLGVNPDDGKSPNILEKRDITCLLEKNRDMIDIAKPLMLNLYRFIENSGFILVLADSQGYVMECLGDRDCLVSAARRLRFIQGASWKETAVGTNAISIVMETGKQVQLSGAEHYCRKHHWWTCSAAPIYGCQGELIAVLDLSGPAQAAYSHTLGMVAAAAAEISMQLQLRHMARELFLVNQNLTGIAHSMSDGMVLFDRLGIVRNINPAACKILGKKISSSTGIAVETVLEGQNELVKKLLNSRTRYAGIECRLGSKADESRCVLSGEPIVDEQGTVTGGIIMLKPAERLYHIAAPVHAEHPPFQFSDIIGKSRSLIEAIRQATVAANTLSSVIVQGESGTGKEMFAQAIHNYSSRRNGPFVAVNCGSIPRELVGSELFGYEDGAFTGAKRGGKSGKFEQASGGTLFLDEIGDMPLEQQVALLRVLQEKRVTRLGGSKTIPVDVRIICATNRDVVQLVESGVFRQDLYYRLNVFKIVIPPLRERGDDVELLFAHFLEQAEREQGKMLTVQPEVWPLIRRYPWPGNVRELHNAVERACNLAENDVVTGMCLSLESGTVYETAPAARQFLPHSVPADRDETVELRERGKALAAGRERQEILSLIGREDGNISRVAAQLGVARSTLYRKMKRYSITY